MDNQEMFELLNKKLDKLMNLVTKVAKTLHLVSVTEKEERAIQIMRERNAQQAFKVLEERSDFKNEVEEFAAPNMDVFKNLTLSDIFSDVLADDVMPQDKE